MKRDPHVELVKLEWERQDRAMRRRWAQQDRDRRFRARQAAFAELQDIIARNADHHRRSAEHFARQRDLAILVGIAVALVAAVLKALLP